MRIIVGLLSVLLMGSCSMEKYCSEHYPPSAFDSIVIKDSLITVHDTITIPAKEDFFVQDSPCPPQIEYHHSEKKGSQTATVDISGGKIKVTCKEDSLIQIVNTQRHQLFTTRSKQVVKMVDAPVKWYWKALAFLNILWVVVVATLLFVYKKS